MWTPQGCQTVCHAHMSVKLSDTSVAAFARAEHTGSQFTGNFRSVAIQCLDRVPSGNNKFTFTAKGHSFNFLIEGGYTYLVVADEG